VRFSATDGTDSTQDARAERAVLGTLGEMWASTRRTDTTQRRDELWSWCIEQTGAEIG
jgi:hypothetical protein